MAGTFVVGQFSDEGKDAGSVFAPGWADVQGHGGRPFEVGKCVYLTRKGRATIAFLTD
ncbi:hypothetical protein D3C77_422750 [compost metagenome]